MTQRERFGSGGGVTDAAARPVDVPAAPLRPAAAPDAAAVAVPLWADIYGHASADQQRQLLALARQQGVLYDHQLPPTNGNAWAADRGRQQLLRLLAGHAEDLKPVRPEPLAVFDTALDADQREAVARALATPDVCLIQGLPGTGKSRVVAEIVGQAAARGERVLLLAPTAAAIDRALELLGDREELWPVRCLGPEERPESLPPALRARTFSERGCHVREHALQSARRQLELAEQLGQCLRQAEPVLDRLREIAGRQQDVELRAESLHRRRAQLAQEVEKETTEPSPEDGTTNRPAELAAPALAGAFAAEMAAFTRVYQERATALDAALADLRRRHGMRTHDRERWFVRVEEGRRLARAKEEGRWWIAAWWRATFRKNLLVQVANLETQLRQIEEELADLDRQSQQLASARQQADEAFAAERRRQIEAETARRRQQLEPQEAVLAHEQRWLEQQWQAACAELGGGRAPTSVDGAGATAVHDVQAAWQRQCQETEQQIAFAREWIRYLEEESGNLAQRLVRYANVVAATTTALPADPNFGDAASVAPFDLLVLEEADQVTKSEFTTLARRARRWVLIGEPALWKDESKGSTAGLPVHPSSFMLHPLFFHGLWRILHSKPHHLPCAWVAEGNRLCCRLKAIAAEERRWLESERVADCPEVELRILVAPRMRPVLAEVVFPASYSIARAKAYIYRELEELPASGAVSGLRWREGPDLLVLEIGASAPTGAVAVELETGVREIVAPGGSAQHWSTCRFEFERAAGWSRQRAEEWVEQHLGLRDRRRTAILDTPHRMAPVLAAFLSDLLFTDGYRLDSSAGHVNDNDTGCMRHGKAAVEFVTSAGWRKTELRPTANGRQCPPLRSGRGSANKGGAGLELDLADRRHRDSLAVEFRDGLPDRGYVNYREACLVVQMIETLAASPCACLGPGRPTLAVITLYAAQAALIRCLIHKSPALAVLPFALAVGVPDEFRQRESSIVLVSLTRSHSHRAVSFGAEPRQLALALTRARHKLIMFGDPGTLVRRSQWQGPLDHLDAAAAAQERELIGHLVGYLEGKGVHPAMFLLREGSSS